MNGFHVVQAQKMRIETLMNRNSNFKMGRRMKDALGWIDGYAVSVLSDLDSLEVQQIYVLLHFIQR